jgi:hypothetical protein
MLASLRGRKARDDQKLISLGAERGIHRTCVMRRRKRDREVHIWSQLAITAS